MPRNWPHVQIVEVYLQTIKDLKEIDPNAEIATSETIEDFFDVVFLGTKSHFSDIGEVDAYVTGVIKIYNKSTAQGLIWKQ